MTRDFLLENGFKDSKQKNGNLVKYDGNESIVFTAEMIRLMDRCAAEKVLEGKIEEEKWFQDKYEDELVRTDGRPMVLGISFNRTHDLQAELSKLKEE